MPTRIAAILPHLPEPWTIVAEPWPGIRGPHRMIGAPDGITALAAAFGHDEAEIDATARLIAAAPVLLEALRNAVAVYVTCATDDGAYPGSHDEPLWVQSARAALAKATNG